MLLLPTVSLSVFQDKQEILGSVSHWAEHLKCRQKYNLFLAIGRGSEYHYWAPVVFAYKMPTGPDRGGDGVLPCKQTVPCFATSLPWDDLSTVPGVAPLPTAFAESTSGLRWGSGRGIFHMKPVSSSHPVHITLKWRRW